jgi:8-oxo-dGTP pyrophosphatase MutT (NUDIX family)
MGKPSIRVLAICVFQHDHKILVFKGFDPTKGQYFYRPLGGGVHYSETSEAAIHREIFEELGTKIVNVRLLGVKENIFIYDGQKGHEIVFIYDAEFIDKSFYTQEIIYAHEDDKSQIEAVWVDIVSRKSDSPPIYPDGLLELILF